MKNIRRVYALIILIVLIVSGIWTYISKNSGTLFVSYLIDTVLFGLLVYLLLGKQRKVKVTSVNPGDFRDWITEGTVSTENRMIINIFTLEDLVKLAMDSETRVIHDSKLNKYYVFNGETAYVHDPTYVSHVMEGKQQIGKILLDQGIIAPDQIETGLYYQKRVGSRLGDSLVALGFIDETTLYSTLASQQNIAYYELDPRMELTDTSWLNAMSIGKARALQAIPLGYREDGKLVIACGESAWTGINTALQEIFGKDIYVVASRPSHIYEMIEKLEEKLESQKIKNSYAELLKERKLEPYERITEEEAELFIKNYQKGKIDLYIFVKALGVANPSILSQISDKETVLSWLTRKNMISGEMTNMIIALNKVIKKQDSKARQERIMPTVLDVLKEAHYITEDAAAWVSHEVASLRKPMRDILVNNYLVGKESYEHANEVVETLKKLTVRSKIF